MDSENASKGGWVTLGKGRRSRRRGRQTATKSCVGRATPPPVAVLGGQPAKTQESSVVLPAGGKKPTSVRSVATDEVSAMSETSVPSSVEIGNLLNQALRKAAGDGGNLGRPIRRISENKAATPVARAKPISPKAAKEAPPTVARDSLKQASEAPPEVPRTNGSIAPVKENKAGTPTPSARASADTVSEMKNQNNKSATGPTPQVNPTESQLPGSTPRKSPRKSMILTPSARKKIGTPRKAAPKKKDTPKQTNPLKKEPPKVDANGELSMNWAFKAQTTNASTPIATFASPRVATSTVATPTSSTTPTASSFTADLVKRSSAITLNPEAREYVSPRASNIKSRKQGKPQTTGRGKKTPVPMVGKGMRNRGTGPATAPGPAPGRFTPPTGAVGNRTWPQNGPSPWVPWRPIPIRAPHNQQQLWKRQTLPNHDFYVSQENQAQGSLHLDIVPY